MSPKSTCRPPVQDTSKNNIEIQARQTPRQSPTVISAPLRPSVTYSTVVRTQATVQPVHAPGPFFNPSFMSTTQSSEQTYIVPPPPFVPNIFRASVSSYGHSNTATQVPRRAKSIPQPQISQQTYNGWPMQVGGMFSIYNTATQQHQSQTHHSPHTPHSLGGSNPPTPITNASFNPVQLLPLPPIHQHQSHNSLATSHHDISASVSGDRPPQYDSSRIGPHINHGSYSEFLQSSERAYDLGGVSPELADEEIVVRESAQHRDPRN